MSTAGTDALSRVAGELALHALRLLAGRLYPRADLSRRLTFLARRRANSKRPAVRALYAGCSDLDGAVARAVDILSAQGLLDDGEYAAWHVGQRVAHKPRSRAMLRAEMKTRGVGDACVQTAMEGYDELEAARRLVTRKWRRDADDVVATRMARQGFPWHIVKRVLAERHAPEHVAGAGAGAGVEVDGAGGSAVAGAGALHPWAPHAPAWQLA